MTVLCVCDKITSEACKPNNQIKQYKLSKGMLGSKFGFSIDWYNNHVQLYM